MYATPAGGKFKEEAAIDDEAVAPFQFLFEVVTAWSGIGATGVVGNTLTLFAPTINGLRVAILLMRLQ